MYPQVIAAPQRRTSGFATTSLVLGIVGVFFGWCTFLVPNILAVIFGHIALNDVAKNNKDGRGMAISGLILGYLFFAASAAWMILVAISSATR